MRFLPCAIALLAGAACSGRDLPRVSDVFPDTTAIKAAIRAQMAAIGAAAKAGDLEGVLSRYTNDAMIREPGLAVQGTDSLRALFTAGLQAVEVVEHATMPERYVFGRDRVVEFASYRERQRDRAKGTETVCDCRYAAEWVRGADGVWRIGYFQSGPRSAVTPLPWDSVGR